MQTVIDEIRAASRYSRRTRAIIEFETSGYSFVASSRLSGALALSRRWSWSAVCPRPWPATSLARVRLPRRSGLRYPGAPIAWRIPTGHSALVWRTPPAASWDRATWAPASSTDAGHRDARRERRWTRYHAPRVNTR